MDIAGNGLNSSRLASFSLFPNREPALLPFGFLFEDLEYLVFIFRCGAKTLTSVSSSFAPMTGCPGDCSKLEFAVHDDLDGLLSFRLFKELGSSLELELVLDSSELFGGAVIDSSSLDAFFETASARLSWAWLWRDAKWELAVRPTRRLGCR